MKVLQHRAGFAVLAGLAVGLVVTTFSGELRADRDVEHELLRANDALTERVLLQEQELAELRGLVLAGGPRPGANNPGATAPGNTPDSAVKAEVKEQLAFRKKVMAIVKPELEAIDARAVAAAKKFDAHVEAFDDHVEAYAKHNHGYEIVGHGWVKLDTMLTPEGVEMLRPTYPNDWIPIRRDNKGGMVPKTTTGPR